MFTAEKPITPLKDLPESELGPAEGYPLDEPVVVDEDEETLSDRLKKRKSDSVTAGSQQLPAVKKAKGFGSKKKAPDSKTGKKMVQKTLIISPAAPPPPPTPKSSSAPEATSSPGANLNTGSASAAGPEEDLVLVSSQTSTQPRSGEPKGKDPAANPEGENLLSFPDCTGPPLTRKKRAHIEQLARECLKTRGLSRAEQEQEVRDISFENILEQVEARDTEVAAGRIAPSQVELITLPEKVYNTINAGFVKVAGEHLELLRNIRDKRKAIQSLKMSNAALEIEKKDLEEILALSHNLSENAQDLKVLESENATLREELKRLRVESEKSIANVLESTNHATEKLEKSLAVQDKKITDLKLQLAEQADLVEDLRNQIRVLKEEQAVLDRNVLGPLDLGVSSSESRLTKLEILGNLTPDLLQILTEAAAAVDIDIADQESAIAVRDKVKTLPKLIEDWKISYARTVAQNALTMVLSHYNSIEISQVTRGVSTTDDDGNPQDIKAIYDSVAGYACRVAEMTNYSEPFFASVPYPPTPQSDSEETEEDAEIPEKASEEEHASASPARKSPSPTPAA